MVAVAAIGVIAGPAIMKWYHRFIGRPHPRSICVLNDDGSWTLVLDRLYWVHGSSVQCEVLGPKGAAYEGTGVPAPAPKDWQVSVRFPADFNVDYGLPLPPATYRVYWQAPTRDAPATFNDVASAKFTVRRPLNFWSWPWVRDVSRVDECDNPVTERVRVFRR
jgi:hypothetical protein